MNTGQPSYSYTQKGRGLYSVFVTGFTAAVAVLFILTRDLVFVTIGGFLALLVFRGISAFMKGEIWSMSIEEGVLVWSYPRWPKSSGRVELSAVRSLVINDCSSALTITFADGTSRKIKLVGFGSRLRDYLATHFPQVPVEYVAGT